MIEMVLNLTYPIILNPTLNVALNATLYQPPQEWYYAWLKEWSPILLGLFQVVLAAALAWLTNKLWNSTNAYSKQVSKQTEIMDKKLLQDIDVLRYHRLRDEMDKLVAPLYSASAVVNIDKNEMGMFSPNDKYVSEFWDEIGPNFYLSRSEKLRENLMRHLILKHELRNPKNDSRKIYNDNAKAIIKEIQERYPLLQKQINNVEKDLDIDKSFSED